MSNLASLRSELLAEYSEEDNKFWTVRNFYEHHNLPARTLLKSSEGKTRPSLQPLDHPSPTKSALRSTSSTQLHPIGRNIFNDVQKAKVPGPGSYEEPLRRYSSHCYIKKDEEHVLAKINKRLKKRQLVNECRGPGLYNPERAFNLSSKSKTPSQGRISHCAFTRAILPHRKIENLYLASTLSSSLYASPAPAPVAYDLTHAAQSSSNFSKPVTHRMSMTQRSSIAKEDSRKLWGIQCLGRGSTRGRSVWRAGGRRIGRSRQCSTNSCTDTPADLNLRRVSR